MADATAANDEPDAHELLLHAAAHDANNSSENDSAALRRFFQFDDDDTVEVVAAVVSLLGSDPVAPVAGKPSQRRPNVERGALEASARLARDYFDDVPVYSAETFRRRFRMQRHLFLRVVQAVEAHDDYFQQWHDATGKLGLSALQKCTAAIRQLAYGTSADAVDEYVRIGESTARKCLNRFCVAVVSIFGSEYLRKPREADIERLLDMHEERGFVGMLGSLDGMHWSWKNCPTAWAGQYTGKESEPTIVLEAVVSRDLWFWHAFFGMPGSHNDINVLERSDLFSDIANNRTPRCNYDINGHTYTMGYYLSDGIYPPWATLIQSIQAPADKKRKHFARQQEAARKDVERAFGVLQAQWAIVKGPARGWSHADLHAIMTACIVLHNMIVEDEQGLVRHATDYDGATDNPALMVTNIDFSQFLERYSAIRDVSTHFQLQHDLVEHLWQRKGNEN